MTPKISVCVPAYNVEDYIEECINSILHQTLKDIEVIVVDDGSTDNTGHILDTMKDDRLRVFHKSNGGPVSARRYAVNAATGEYVTFVDSDDFISEKACETLYQGALDSGAEVIFDQSYFSVHNSDITIVSKRLEPGLYSVENNNMEYIWNHLWGDYEDRIAQSACMSLYKREAAANVWRAVPDELMLTEDHAFIAVLAVTVKSMYIIRKPLYYYRYRNNSLFHTAQPNVLSMIQRNYEFVSQYFGKHEYSKVLMKQLKYYVIQSLMELKFLSGTPITFYLFPYEKVPAGSRIILYGAAEVGGSYYNQLQQNHYCKLMCWSDIRFEELKEKGVVSPDAILDTPYDYIVIAVLGGEQAVSIADGLVQKYNVDRERIIIHDPKSLVDFLDIE